MLDGSSDRRCRPEDTLAAQEIETIRQWIDEGAHWPDELANEFEAPPPDPAALALIAQIRGVRVGGEPREALLDAIARQPAVLNARGPDGATPFMYVALYGDVDWCVAHSRPAAIPTMANDAGATALMWAATMPTRLALLLEGGADVDAASVFGRTPLTLASSVPNDPAVEALLARGATPSPQALGAAAFGSEAILRRLIAAGAKDKGESAGMALSVGCVKCLDAYRRRAERR